MQKKYNKVHKHFSGKIKLFFPKKKFKKIWTDLEAANGSLKEIGTIQTNEKDGIYTSSLPLKFEKLSLNLLLSTNEKNKIVGLNFLPPAYVTPSWAKNKVYGKERIVVKTDSFELDGELIVPSDCNNCPVVVLVHGSGPSDMDGTFGPNKLYLDLAYGFANRGIATIRYNKRTLTYGKTLAKLDSMTIYEETINDALSAVKLAKTFDFLDSNQVYVLGHSLGAYCSPLIAQKTKNLAGIIVLAGPARPLCKIIPEQYDYIFNLDSNLTKMEKEKLFLAQQEALFIQNLPSEVTELKEMGSNSMLWYHRMMLKYDPIKTIDSLTCRSLIIQGDRDYQVRYETEFTAFKSGLSHNPQVQFELIPGANHFMIYGDKPSEPSEYYNVEHIQNSTLDILGKWILEK